MSQFIPYKAPPPEPDKIQLKDVFGTRQDDVLEKLLEELIAKRNPPNEEKELDKSNTEE